MEQKYLRVERDGGQLINPPLGFIYVERSSMYGEVKRRFDGTLFSGHGYKVPSELNQVCFLSRPHQSKKKISRLSFLEEVDLDSFVSVSGKRVPAKYELQFACVGTYYATSGEKVNVHFWLQDGLITFLLHGEEKQVPFSKVYFLAKESAWGYEPAYFLRLDQIHPSVVALKGHDDDELLFELEGAIRGINKAQQGVLTLECKVEEAKALFSLYLTRELPSPLSLVQSGNITLYRELSDYLGVSFWTNYFLAIEDSLHYRTLTIPSEGSVEEYLSFLILRNLREQYEKFWPRVNDANFYFALVERGMSVSFLERELQRNPSWALQKFLEQL